jgi:acyl dehydratase
MTAATTRRPIAKGDQVTPLELNLTPTKIVAGAIASRDFMPAHHDPEFAKSQGAPDIFLNILSTNGYVSRFITDWAGPDAMVRSIKIRLGVPAVPGKLLRFTGEVVSTSHEGDEGVVEVSMRAANDLGDHATGTVVVSLPRNLVAA